MDNQTPNLTDQIVDAAKNALPGAFGLNLILVHDLDQGEQLLVVQGRGERTEFRVLTKTVRRVEDLGLIKAQVADLRHRVLITPHLTAHLARKAMELGIQFLDAAGNIHVATPGMLLCLTGNKAPEGAEVGGRAGVFKGFNRKGLQVLFGLLAGGALKDTPYRDFGAAVGVARGTVGEVLKDLIATGYVLQKEGERIILRQERLLEGWIATYPHKLRPHLEPKRYRAGAPGWWKNVVLDPARAQWGGEVAADRLTGDLQPGTVTVYATEPPEKLAARFRLRPDPQGDIEILQRFWNFPNPEGYPADLVPAMLIYADLIASGDPRNLDIARKIHDTHLAP